MAASAVQFEIHNDGVALLTIDQPDSRVNILTQQIWTELEAAFDSLKNRNEVKALVIGSAKPGVFIAGADLKLLANAPAPNDPEVRDFIERGLRVLEKLESLPFPTCAAIDGAALGGGLEVALACDFRVVGDHPKVQLGLPEVKLGLIPGWGGTQRLPRIVGMNFAARIMATGQSIASIEAIEMGLVSGVRRESEDFPSMACRVMSDGDYAAARRRKLEPIPLNDRQLIAPEPKDFSILIDVMMRGATLPLKQAIRIETEAFLNLAGSPESKRLIGEFFAGRKR